MAANAKNRVLDGDMRVISSDLSRESRSNEVTEITSVMDRPWGNAGTTDLDGRFNGGQLRAPECGQDREGAWVAKETVVSRSGKRDSTLNFCIIIF